MRCPFIVPKPNQHIVFTTLSFTISLVCRCLYCKHLIWWSGLIYTMTWWTQTMTEVDILSTSFKMTIPVLCFWSNTTPQEDCRRTNKSPVQFVPPPPWRAVEVFQSVTPDLQRQNKMRALTKNLPAHCWSGRLAGRKLSSVAWQIKTEGERACLEGGWD